MIDAVGVASTYVPVHAEDGDDVRGAMNMQHWEGWITPGPSERQLLALVSRAFLTSHFAATPFRSV